jgi:O-succinylhomoserine sulfhydrylase
MNATRTVSLSTNLGDVKTLVAHPASTSHGRLAEEQRQLAGIEQSLIRVAVGLEHLDDLKADFVRGFDAL